MKIDNNIVTISPVNMEERKALGIRAGDTVKVWVKIEEKGKTRLQVFEGLVLAVKHGGEAGGTFTVHKVTSGVGVERIFPLYSPTIDKLEIVKRARVRRSKLYLLREKVAREAKRILRRSEQVSVATKGSAELEEERKRAEAEATAKREADEKAAAEAEAAQAVVETPVAPEGATSEADDLTKIEGIGPVIAKVLNDNGIMTFAQLAEAKDEDTQAMIKDVAGNHQAGTWNEQASLARDGKWDELKTLQEKLNRGVEASE